MLLVVMEAKPDGCVSYGETIRFDDLRFTDFHSTLRFGSRSNKLSSDIFFYIFILYTIIYMYIYNVTAVCCL